MNPSLTPAVADVAAPPVVLSVQNLRHVYAAARPRHGGHARPAALDDVSFNVHRGDIFGVLGPNGGGKSTLFRILATLLRPTAGDARVLDLSVTQQAHRVRAAIGVVFQSPSLDGKLTTRENLLHQGHLHGLSGTTLHQRIDQWLAYFGLDDRRHDYVERLSGGLRRRVEIAKSLLHEPTLLLLDEPSTGLDPAARRELWRVLDRLRRERGMTVALTTHFMDEADRCDRLAILAAGKLIALDTPARIKAAIRGDVITIEPAPGLGETGAAQLAARIAAAFGPWPPGNAPLAADGKIYVERPDGPAFVARVAGELAGSMHSITLGRPTLDDVFLHLTGHALSTDDAIDAAHASPR